MKYKVNDEVLIKARIKDMSYVDMMYVCELITEPSVCIRFKSPTECIVADKTYADGLKDAWELAKKLMMMPHGICEDIFDGDLDDVFALTPAEALAKIEAYEKGKEIKVKNIVKFSNGDIGVVTYCGSETAYVMWEDGRSGYYSKDILENTGRTAESLDLLLRQIGE